jgi:two-component system chemotaxis sensor kinase CheA
MADNPVQEFVDEAKEILARISGTLTELEPSKKSRQRELIAGIYRDFHTLKGTAQLFGFKHFAKIAHAVEAVLDPIRQGHCSTSPSLVDKIYSAIDCLETSCQEINQNQTDESMSGASTEFLHTFLEDIFKELGLGSSPSLKNSIYEEAHVERVEKRVEEMPDVTEKKEASEIESLSQKEASSPNLRPEHRPEQQTDNPQSNREDSEITNGAQETKGQETKGIDSSIRVQVALLDKLMNLVGELVLVRNQVLQYGSKTEDLTLLKLSQELDIVTSDLQGEVMKTRMQPVGNVFSKFNRTVRDLSRDLEKQIQIITLGAETELDKTLIEAIKDPLTHIVRNACDHGLETPDQREQKGKKPQGTVKLHAFHEGGQVIIEISDDGKGLDPQVIGKIAVEKGLISQEELTSLPEKEIQSLIFKPGFSTAEQVSSVSGRGVGMDVVKTNIERIGGTFELESEKNVGTSIRLTIPLTLAIVPAMKVRCGDQQFAIPQVKLVELVKIDPNESKNHVEELEGQPMLRLRGDLLPLIHWKSVIEGFQEDLGSKKNEDLQVVVLDAEGRRFGFVVDEVLDTADIVVKPLNRFMKSLQLFSGATIMGDGSVALIIDVVGLASKGQVSAEQQVKESFSSQIANSPQDHAFAEEQEYVVFKTMGSSNHCIPLCLVHRLEEINTDRIEYSGQQAVIQYREGLLPLLDLDDELGYKNRDHDTKKSNKASIIVVEKRNRHFGLLVHQIIDVVSTTSSIDDSFQDREFLVGNIVHDSKIMVVVDALSIVDSAIERLVQDNPDDKKEHGNLKLKGQRILLVEDMAFFRKHVEKSLSKEGLEVSLAKNGKEALELLESKPSDYFDVIVSDIEMPEMDGFELASTLKKNEKLAHIPLIALTTKFKDRDIEKGRSVGFHSYLEKFKAEQLLETIQRSMDEKKSSLNTNQQSVAV